MSGLYRQLDKHIGAFAVSLRVVCHAHLIFVQVLYGIFLSFGEVGELGIIRRQ